MKRLVCLSLVVMFGLVLSACASATTRTGNKMINPGDKIGDFLITTGKEGDVTYTWELGCVNKGKEKIIRAQQL
jgi:uncharacterized protein YceK